MAVAKLAKRHNAVTWLISPFRGQTKLYHPTLGNESFSLTCLLLLVVMLGSWVGKAAL